MKQLLISLLILTAVPAIASNGSGTMGIVASEVQGIDLTQTPVIKFDGFTDNDKVKLTQIIEVKNDLLITQDLVVTPVELPGNWIDAAKASALTNTWQKISPAD
ncbi:MAG: hypothetical protein EOP06_08050 [Proteobacteria bacterium]|nr:MAG: hypothetical protein EOP06_08050 [Pseudomonadota bacterium]